MKRQLIGVSAAAVSCFLSISPVAAEQPVTPATLQPCPFTAAEVEEALGLVVDLAEVSDVTFPSGRDVGCYYTFKDSLTVLAVRQIWDPSGTEILAPAVRKEAPPHPGPGGHGGGRVEPIPGDPDGARWEHGPEGEPDISLSYGRRHASTKIIAYGTTFRNADMQPKLLRLKRVP
mgnify:CR=1 FL=1